MAPHWLVWVRLGPIGPHRQTEVPVFGPKPLLNQPHWLVWVRLGPIGPHPQTEIPVFGPKQLLIQPHEF